VSEKEVEFKMPNSRTPSGNPSLLVIKNQIKLFKLFPPLRHFVHYFLRCRAYERMKYKVFRMVYVNSVLNQC